MLQLYTRQGVQVQPPLSWLTSLLCWLVLVDPHNWRLCPYAHEGVLIMAAALHRLCYAQTMSHTDSACMRCLILVHSAHHAAGSRLARKTKLYFLHVHVAPMACCHACASSVRHVLLCLATLCESSVDHPNSMRHAFTILCLQEKRAGDDHRTPTRRSCVTQQRT